MGRRSQYAVCPECNRHVRYEPIEGFVRHNTSDRSHAKRCDGTGMTPMEPGGSDVFRNAWNGGLPELGKNR